jgi:hypothetical protein
MGLITIIIDTEYHFTAYLWDSKLLSRSEKVTDYIFSLSAACDHLVFSHFFPELAASSSTAVPTLGTLYPACVWNHCTSTSVSFLLLELGLPHFLFSPLSNHSLMSISPPSSPAMSPFTLLSLLFPTILSARHGYWKFSVFRQLRSPLRIYRPLDSTTPQIYRFIHSAYPVHRLELPSK